MNLTKKPPFPVIATSGPADTPGPFYLVTLPPFRPHPVVIVFCSEDQYEKVNPRFVRRQIVKGQSEFWEDDKGEEGIFYVWVCPGDNTWDDALLAHELFHFVDQYCQWQQIACPEFCACLLEEMLRRVWHARCTPLEPNISDDYGQEFERLLERLRRLA